MEAVSCRRRTLVAVYQVGERARLPRRKIFLLNNLPFYILQSVMGLVETKLNRVYHLVSDSCPLAKRCRDLLNRPCTDFDAH